MGLFREKEVRKILTEFNSSVDDGSKLDVDKVCAALAKEGAGVPAGAKGISFEDISKAGPPMAIARAISYVWRGNDEKPKAEAAPDAEVKIGGVGGPFAEFALAFGNVSALNDKTLLENYDPRGRADVIVELDQRGGGKSFIAFADKLSLRVDVPRSFDCLQLLKLGVEIGTTTNVNGNLVELFKPGEMPDLALPICPIHGCHLVGDDELCPQCSRNWKGVSTDVRELVWCHTQEVLAEMPNAQDARLTQIFAALGDANDQYWAQAKLSLEKRKATGQVIVLVKPVKHARTGQPARR